MQLNFSSRHHWLTPYQARRTHEDTVKYHTDWVLDRVRSLPDEGARALIVSLTVTFRPGTISPEKCLKEFGRFYSRLTRLLVMNPDRPSKRELLPFSIAYLDDPSTRWKGRRPRFFYDHPEACPHVHGVLLVHPALADMFRDIAPSLEAVWRDISPLTNATLFADVPAAERIRHLLASGDPTAREAIEGWIAYSAKLIRTSCDPDINYYEVFPR